MFKTIFNKINHNNSGSSIPFILPVMLNGPTTIRVELPNSGLTSNSITFTYI